MTEFFRIHSTSATKGVCRLSDRPAGGAPSWKQSPSVAGASVLLATAPELMVRIGVGSDTAAALPGAAGDNPERLLSEAAWAHFRGVAPVPSDSGRHVEARRSDVQ